MKRFGGFRALDGISLYLAPGEVLGLVGPNGSGKTTCINVISGLYAPDEGKRHLRRRVDRRPCRRICWRGAESTAPSSHRNRSCR